MTIARPTALDETRAHALRAGLSAVPAPSTLVSSSAGNPGGTDGDLPGAALEHVGSNGGARDASRAPGASSEIGAESLRHPVAPLFISRRDRTLFDRFIRWFFSRPARREW